MSTYVHELKTDHEPFEAVFSGAKTHEIRSGADRDFKVGDTLILRETRYSHDEMRVDGRPLEYTGRTVERIVTHIQSGYGLPFGIVVMSLARRTSNEEIVSGQAAVGVVGTMPGTEGFTMACFEADHVPAGTKLYASIILSSNK